MRNEFTPSLVDVNNASPANTQTLTNTVDSVQVRIIEVQSNIKLTSNAISGMFSKSVSYPMVQIYELNFYANRNNKKVLDLMISDSVHFYKARCDHAAASNLSFFRLKNTM